MKTLHSRRQRLGRAPSKPPAPARVDVAGIRREQVVEAAASIIATQGIQSLSLSAIEAETGMSRGQLTYYFRTKEDILLAVFDRTVRRMQERMAAGEPEGCGQDVRSLIQSLFSKLLTEPIAADFTQLQYSFLAQTGARDDFRQRLASLYEQWRLHMASGLGQGSESSADPRLIASFVQALLHGLVMQLQADPAAFDRTAMLAFCIDQVGSMLGQRRASLSSGHTLPGGNGHG